MKYESDISISEPMTVSNNNPELTFEKVEEDSTDWIQDGMLVIEWRSSEALSEGRSIDEIRDVAGKSIVVVDINVSPSIGTNSLVFISQGFVISSKKELLLIE